MCECVRKSTVVTKQRADASQLTSLLCHTKSPMKQVLIACSFRKCNLYAQRRAWVTCARISASLWWSSTKHVRLDLQRIVISIAVVAAIICYVNRLQIIRDGRISNGCSAKAYHSSLQASFYWTAFYERWVDNFHDFNFVFTCFECQYSNIIEVFPCWRSVRVPLSNVARFVRHERALQWFHQCYLGRSPGIDADCFGVICSWMCDTNAQKWRYDSWRAVFLHTHQNIHSCELLFKVTFISNNGTSESFPPTTLGWFFDCCCCCFCL
jgi:hypothetical protein